MKRGLDLITPDGIRTFDIRKQDMMNGALYSLYEDGKYPSAECYTIVRRIREARKNPDAGFADVYNLFNRQGAIDSDRFVTIKSVHKDPPCQGALAWRIMQYALKDAGKEGYEYVCLDVNYKDYWQFQKVLKYSEFGIVSKKNGRIRIAYAGDWHRIYRISVFDCGGMTFVTGRFNSKPLDDKDVVEYWLRESDDNSKSLANVACEIMPLTDIRGERYSKGLRNALWKHKVNFYNDYIAFLAPSPQGEIPDALYSRLFNDVLADLKKRDVGWIVAESKISGVRRDIFKSFTVKSVRHYFADLGPTEFAACTDAKNISSHGFPGAEELDRPSMNAGLVQVSELCKITGTNLSEIQRFISDNPDPSGVLSDRFAASLLRTAQRSPEAAASVVGRLRAGIGD